MQEEERVELVSESDSKEAHTHEESASQKMLREDQNSRDDTEESQMQNSLPMEPTPAQSSWIAGWFTTGSKSDEEPLKAMTESLPENTYRGRKIVVTVENEEPNDKEEQEPSASAWFQGGLTDFLFFGEENMDLASEKNDQQIHDVSGVSGQETAGTELLTEESESQESESNWFSLGLSDVLNFGHSEKDPIAMEDQQSRETEDEANKNKAEQTLNQKAPHKGKDPEVRFKAVTGEEDKENCAQEIIISNSNMPNPKEMPASMGTLNHTKSTSNRTKASFDMLTNDKEKPTEPYYSEQDLVSESQPMKNVEAKKRNQESESKHEQSGWYINIYNIFISYNMDTYDNQQGHESIVSDEISSSPSLPQNCNPSDTKNTEEKPDIAEEQSHFLSFSHLADILMFKSSTAKEEKAQSLHDDVSFSEETTQTKNHDEILQGNSNRGMKVQVNLRVREQLSEKDEGAIQKSHLFSSLAVHNNEHSNEKPNDFVKSLSHSDASHILSAETLVQSEASPRQSVPLFRSSSTEEHVSKKIESQESTNIKGYYNGPVSKVSLHLPAKLNLKNTVETGTCLLGKSKLETMQKAQNSPHTYIQECVNTENELPIYGELPGTADNHLDIRKTSCDSELILETPEKGKPVKCCDTEQNSASKIQFNMDDYVREKIPNPENKNDPLGFYENNIKDFSQGIFNNEQEEISEESPKLTPDQPFSPHSSSSDFSLTGSKTCKEICHSEDIRSFRMEGKTC